MTTRETSSTPIKSDTAYSVGAHEENPVEKELVDSHSAKHPVQRSIGTRNPLFRYRLAYTHASKIGTQEPTGYLEAVPGPENEQWLAAMNLEVKSFEALVSWTLVDEPRSCKRFYI